MANFANFGRMLLSCVTQRPTFLNRFEYYKPCSTISRNVLHKMIGAIPQIVTLCNLQKFRQINQLFS